MNIKITEVQHQSGGDASPSNSLNEAPHQLHKLASKSISSQVNIFQQEVKSCIHDSKKLIREGQGKKVIPKLIKIIKQSENSDQFQITQRQLFQLYRRYFQCVYKIIENTHYQQFSLKKENRSKSAKNTLLNMLNQGQIYLDQWNQKLETIVQDVEDNVEMELEDCNNFVDQRRIISEEFHRIQVEEPYYIEFDGDDVKNYKLNKQSQPNSFHTNNQQQPQDTDQKTISMARSRQQSQSKRNYKCVQDDEISNNNPNSNNGFLSSPSQQLTQIKRNIMEKSQIQIVNANPTHDPKKLKLYQPATYYMKEFLKASVLMVLAWGMYSEFQQNGQQAIYFYKEAQKIMDKIKDKGNPDIMHISIQLKIKQGNLMFQCKKFEQAAEYYEQGMDLLQQEFFIRNTVFKRNQERNLRETIQIQRAIENNIKTMSIILQNLSMVYEYLDEYYLVLESLRLAFWLSKAFLIEQYEEIVQHIKGMYKEQKKKFSTYANEQMEIRHFFLQNPDLKDALINVERKQDTIQHTQPQDDDPMDFNTYYNKLMYNKFNNQQLNNNQFVFIRDEKHQQHAKQQQQQAQKQQSNLLNQTDIQQLKNDAKNNQNSTNNIDFSVTQVSTNIGYSTVNTNTQNNFSTMVKNQEKLNTTPNTNKNTNFDTTPGTVNHMTNQSQISAFKQQSHNNSTINNNFSQLLNNSQINQTNQSQLNQQHQQQLLSQTYDSSIPAQNNNNQDQQQQTNRKLQQKNQHLQRFATMQNQQLSSRQKSQSKSYYQNKQRSLYNKSSSKGPKQKENIIQILENQENPTKNKADNSKQDNQQQYQNDSRTKIGSSGIASPYRSPNSISDLTFRDQKYNFLSNNSTNKNNRKLNNVSFANTTSYNNIKQFETNTSAQYNINKHEPRKIKFKSSADIMNYFNKSSFNDKNNQQYQSQQNFKQRQKLLQSSLEQAHQQDREAKILTTNKYWQSNKQTLYSEPDGNPSSINMYTADLQAQQVQNNNSTAASSAINQNKSMSQSQYVQSQTQNFYDSDVQQPNSISSSNNFSKQLVRQQKKELNTIDKSFQNIILQNLSRQGDNLNYQYVIKGIGKLFEDERFDRNEFNFAHNTLAFKKMFQAKDPQYVETDQKGLNTNFLLRNDMEKNSKLFSEFDQSKEKIKLMTEQKKQIKIQKQQAIQHRKIQQELEKEEQDRLVKNMKQLIIKQGARNMGLKFDSTKQTLHDQKMTRNTQYSTSSNRGGGKFQKSFTMSSDEGEVEENIENYKEHAKKGINLIIEDIDNNLIAYNREIEEKLHPRKTKEQMEQKEKWEQQNKKKVFLADQTELALSTKALHAKAEGKIANNFADIARINRNIYNSQQSNKKVNLLKLTKKPKKVKLLSNSIQKMLKISMDENQKEKMYQQEDDLDYF